MEVLKYRSVDKGNLLGFLNLKVTKWGVALNDLSVFQKNGHRWVNLPSRQYEQDGEKKFFPYISFETKEMKDAFSKKVLEALDEFSKVQPKETAASVVSQEPPF